MGWLVPRAGAWHGALALAVIVLFQISPAAAQGPTSRISGKPARGIGTRPTLASLATDVVRSLTEYRASLEKLKADYEADLGNATEQLETMQGLDKHTLASVALLQQSEQTWMAARSRLEEVRAWIEEADQMLIEASVREQLAKLAPLPLGGYQETAGLIRFNGRTPWSLSDLPTLAQSFARKFGRTLPLSAVGQTPVHDRLGLDHHNAVDVQAHPDSAEGRWLVEFLRKSGIPFIAVRSAIPGAATGAHIHVGLPSPRLSLR